MTEQSLKQSNYLPSNRPRKHTWSRPVRIRNASIDIEHLTPNIVDGTAHICFSKDKSWFQGNVIEHSKGDISGSIYKLSGKIINMVDQYDDQKISEGDIFQLTTNWLPVMEGENDDPALQSRTPSNPHLLKLLKSDGESSSNSPGSQTLSSISSGEDDLDSDLVKAAIARLNIDDTPASSFTMSRSSSMSVHSPASPSGCDSRSDIDSSTQKYNIALTEFETGMTYNMEGIYKQNSSSECTIVGEDRCNQISFKSKKSYKGNSADIIISRHLGPSFVDKNMSVFVGDIRLRYIDPVCRPSNKAISQWCN